MWWYEGERTGWTKVAFCLSAAIAAGLLILGLAVNQNIVLDIQSLIHY